MSGYEQANFDATVAQLEQNYGLDSGEAKEVATVYYFGGDNEDDWLGDSSCPAMSGDLAPIIQDVTGEPAMDAYGTAAYEQDIIHYSQRYGVSEDQAKQAIDLYLSGHISGDMWIEKDPVDGEFKEDYLEVGPETGVGYPICPIMSNDIEPYLNYVIGAGPKPATPTSEDIEKIQLGQLGSSTKPDVVTIGGKTNEIISLSAAGNTPEEKERVYNALTLAVYDKSGVTYSNGSGSTNGSSATPTYSSSTTPTYDGGSSTYDGGSSTYDGGSSTYDGGSSTYDGGSSTYDGGSSIPTYSGSGSTYDRKSGSSYKELIENINTNDVRKYSGIINEVNNRYRLGTSDTASILTRYIADKRIVYPDYRISRDDNIIGSIRENRNTSKLIEAVRETKTGGVPAVAADLNCDGKVNLADFGILLSFWEKDPSGAGSCKSPDINQDGAVNLTDFSIMMSYWNYEGQGQSSYEGWPSYDWWPSQSNQESYEEMLQKHEALRRWEEQLMQENQQRRESYQGLPY
jgi:hypothetical protein